MKRDVLDALSGIFPERIPCKETLNHPGFIISSCGGLHGNIPMENMFAYFKTRDKMGIPVDI